MKSGEALIIILFAFILLDGTSVFAAETRNAAKFNVTGYECMSPWIGPDYSSARADADEKAAAACGQLKAIRVSEFVDEGGYVPPQVQCPPGQASFSSSAIYTCN